MALRRIARRPAVDVSLCLSISIFASTPLAAQWSPAGELAGVPVSEDCERTAQAPARAAEGPQIFTCSSAVEAIDGEVAHAADFFLVHEYAHIANENASESQADCWAASELGATPDGFLFVGAVARWLEARGDEFVEGLGTGADRAWSIRDCSGLDFPEPASGNACCTAAGNCQLSEEGSGMPIGTWCYCRIGDTAELADGLVCDAAAAAGSV